MDPLCSIKQLLHLWLYLYIVYASPLYPKGPNPTQIFQDIELRVNEDTPCHDTLLMDITKEDNGYLSLLTK